MHKVLNSGGWQIALKLVPSADEFEAERQNLLDRVDTCSAQKAEQHKVEWESKRRAEEVKELQKVNLWNSAAVVVLALCQHILLAADILTHIICLFTCVKYPMYEQHVHIRRLSVTRILSSLRSGTDC